MGENSDLWETALGFIGLLLIIVVLFKFFGWEFFPSNITVYAAICREKVVSNHCNKPIGVFSAEVFSPSPSRQQVLYLDYPNGWRKYTDCAVKDRENWTCWGSSTKKSEFGFKNGNYWTKIAPSEINSYYDHFPSNQTDKIYFMSRAEWILQACKNKSSYDFVCLAKETFADEYSINQIFSR